MRAEKAQRILITLTILSFIVAGIALLGELLGWWNDLGEVLLIVATIVGALGGVATMMVGSSSEEVRTVHGAVVDTGSKLDSMDGKLDSMDTKLDKLDTLEKLEKLDAVDGKLDAAQVKLDEQTGVLGRQVEILTDIRERL